MRRPLETRENNEERESLLRPAKEVKFCSHFNVMYLSSQTMRNRLLTPHLWGFVTAAAGSPYTDPALCSALDSILHLVHTALSTLHCPHCTIHTALSAPYRAHRTVCTTPSTLHHPHCTVRPTPSELPWRRVAGLSPAEIKACPHCIPLIQPNARPF